MSIANSLPHTRTRFSALAGMIGPPMFLGILGLLDILDGHVDVSQHELGRYGVLMHLDFLLFGLLTLALAIGLRSEIRRGKLAWAGIILLGLFGLGPVLATFTLDPGQGPPVTWHGTLHFFGFVFIALALIPACFVFARVFSSDPRWRWYQWYSLATGIALAAVAFAPSTTPDNGNAYPIWTGPASMLELVLALVWLELAAIRLWLLSREQETAREDAPRRPMTTPAAMG